jgi:DNA-binding response OmpR family regulator
VPRTVLVVDDSPAFRSTARTLLRARGYDVVGVAEDVASGLRAASELQPDCVLLDVNLPDGDGVRRAHEFAAHVVLVSTLDVDADRPFLPKAELASPRLIDLLGPP